MSHAYKVASIRLAVAAILTLAIALQADARNLTGSKRGDVLRGTASADIIRGGGGADRLSGRGGSDRLSGGQGNDRLSGGRGNDRLSGGPGDDRLTGGPGKDILDCGRGRDHAAADRADRVRRNCETVTGRGGGGGTDQPPPPPSIQGDFTGNLNTTVRYLSVCTGQVLGDQTTQIPSRITIRLALQPNPADLPADTPEVNPFNLILGQTNVAGTIAPGSINLASAARFRFSPIRSLTLKYWRLNLNGTALTGALTEDNREPGAALNLLAAHQELIACQPQFGTYVNQLASPRAPPSPAPSHLSKSSCASSGARSTPSTPSSPRSPPPAAAAEPRQHHIRLHEARRVM